MIEKQMNASDHASADPDQHMLVSRDTECVLGNDDDCMLVRRNTNW